ncbi:von Willebrand factor type A domain-containing protein [Pedobacter sp. SD-b]|uniref:von Willebrand factor type A domain-containing protein n=1 Tax=Pedobacter segetis TaxID=2793069 RepID=A0ABS1BJY1_9SPHI|nr:VWA domain-containing protein [Pedobacter segetis]MBK0383082.1 von Willebrand factor type A domain-containing protein [Pedobacter segetis]
MKTICSLIIAATLLMAFKTDDTKLVSGYVYDVNQQVLVGATVSSKLNPKIKTNTGSNGFFKLKVSQTEKKILVSFIGFETREIVLTPKTLKIILKAVNANLDELVVAGYGSQNKREMLVSNTKSMAASSYMASPMLSNVGYNTESYNAIDENGFKNTKNDPLSTFSIDVDAVSYSNMRRFIQSGQMPPKDAIRVEEMINYFGYDYPEPKDGDPVSIITDVADAPWNKNHRLVRIGLKAKSIKSENLPASNLVFLIDVSGSMQGPDRLGLLKTSMKLLTDQLRPNDKVAILVYAGAAGLVLPGTNGNQKNKIKDALTNLSAGGSTAGGAGIKLAYQTAKNNFIKGGNNRVILATDGDFNVGASSDAEMQRLIESYKNDGIFLSVLGFGSGNLKDSKMEAIADKGNGNYYYIDGINEAKKVLINEFGGTLFTVAKDVKLQVEFNPAKVAAYRLVGYENRLLNNEDFKDDKKDAGEMGAGHTVTALYEIIPEGYKDEFIRNVDEMKYQTPKEIKNSNELLTVKMRYKNPDENKSQVLSVSLVDHQQKLANATLDFKFVAAVAEYGLLIGESGFKQNANYDQAIALAKSGKGKDDNGYRSEFIQLIENAKLLAKKDVISKNEDE